MKEIKYVTNILHLTLIGSQSLKNIDINVYYEDEDHVANNGFNLDNMNEYEERIE